MATFQEILSDFTKLGSTIGDRFYLLTDNGSLYLEIAPENLPTHPFYSQPFVSVEYWMASLRETNYGFPHRENFRPETVLKINCNMKKTENDEWPDAVKLALEYCVTNDLRAILTGKSLNVVGVHLVDF